MLEWYQQPYGWDTALTILGIAVAFGGAIFAIKAFPNITATAKIPQTNYIPHHIDQDEVVVMIRRDHKKIDIKT